VSAVLLLDYCPPHLRADLWDNDGFDPENRDHIAEDPDRSLIMTGARAARREGVTRSEHFLAQIAGDAELLGMELCCAEFITEREDLLQLAATLRELRHDAKKCLVRLSRRLRALRVREGGAK
jgi:hypothetical protein